MSFTWVVGACILAVASFVFGLTGFGIGLVSLALLPFFVPPATVVPLITLYGAAFALVMTIQLRRDVMFPQLVSLLRCCPIRYRRHGWYPPVRPH